MGTFGTATHVLARMIIKHFGIDIDKETQVIALGGDAARRWRQSCGICVTRRTFSPLPFEPEI